MLLALWVSTASAQAQRYAISLSGDSIVESAWLRGQDGGWGSWGVMIADELRARGIRVGGYGFVPMHASVFTYSPWTFFGSWQHDGLIFNSGTPSRYGPDGLPSLTTDPQASATIVVRGQRLAILYGRQRGGGRFSAQIDSQRPRQIATASRRAQAGQRWLTLGPGPHRLRLFGFRGGPVVLAGLVVSAASGRQPVVEIDQLGHGGSLAKSNLAAPQRQALRQLRPRLTVIMFGNNEEIDYSLYGRDSRRDLIAGIGLRARIARRSGRCLVVPHAPNNNPLWLQRAYARAARDGARRGHCRYADLFNDIWEANGSQMSGLTLDGVHPTTSGYRLMARRLAAYLASSLATSQKS